MEENTERDEVYEQFGQTMGRFWEWLSPENGKAQFEMQYPVC